MDNSVFCLPGFIHAFFFIGSFPAVGCLAVLYSVFCFRIRTVFILVLNPVYILIYLIASNLRRTGYQIRGRGVPDRGAYPYKHIVTVFD